MNTKYDQMLRVSRKMQIGQFFHPAGFIHDTPEGIATIEKYISEYKIGGLTFFYSRESVETNFNRKQGVTQHINSIEKLVERIQHYQKLSDVPLLISIDAEWGLGMRIASHPPFPYPLTLASTGDVSDSFEVGKAIGKELRQVGVHLNLAPVVDVNTNPRNPVIGYRSFGTDPQKVFKYAEAYYEGLQSEGILGCLKHFPGHGDTQTDSHLALPIIDKSLDELHKNELYTFKNLIQKGVDCVMTGHIQIPALDDKPCSLSRKIIQNLLQEELGFDGAIMSDALNMQSVFQTENTGEVELEAFLAGNDMLSFSKNIPDAIQLIDENVSDERINASLQRVMHLKEKANISAHPQNTISVPDSHSLRLSIARKAITVLKSPTENVSLPDAVIYVHKKIQDTQFLPEGFDFYELEEVLKNDTLPKNQAYILAVYPPSYKPLQKFGFEESVLAQIHQIAEKYQTTLCLFGNPYAMELFDIHQFHAVVIAYQDLPEFEQSATEYFSGNLQANGKLPLTYAES